MVADEMESGVSSVSGSVFPSKRPDFFFATLEKLKTIDFFFKFHLI